ncbi:MAG: helix-turn-helix domain-containing protein [Thermoplasmata archaeon]
MNSNAKTGPKPVRGARTEGKDSSSGPDAYALYRIVAPLGKDSWGYRFSRAHPGVRLELLDRLEVGPDLILVEVRMMGPGAFDWAQESQQEEGVVHVESHVEDARTVLYRVTFRSPSIHIITRQHRVLIHYPIIIQNGISQFETFGSGPQMRAYLEELRKRIGPSRVTAVRRANLPAQTLGLTQTQGTIFRDAVALGYFQSPRAITVTGLAERIGRSKSTVSTALVKIQRRLAESALRVDLATFKTTS